MAESGTRFNQQPGDASLRLGNSDILPGNRQPGNPAADQSVFDTELADRFREGNTNPLSVGVDFDQSESNAEEISNETRAKVNQDGTSDLEPRENPLHQYASHTYRLTLGVQNLATHRATMERNNVIDTPQLDWILMASGGAKEVDDARRAPMFEEDFYIESYRMTTIVGDNEKDYGSNTVALEFVIIEPYAVSLIERLIALANMLRVENYIEIPYVMKIDFIGYDDDGAEIGVIPGITKYIPFRMTYMNFKIDTNGTKYECQAIPTAHMAFDQTVVNTPIQMSMEAGTVSEFFFGKGAKLDKKTWTSAPSQGDNNTTEIGIQNAWNRWHRSLVGETNTDNYSDPLRSIADEIEFIIHPDIADSVMQADNIANKGLLKTYGAAGGERNAIPNTKKRVMMSINQGTDARSIISDVIEASDWWINQVTRREQIKNANAAAREPQTRQELPTLIRPAITSTYEMKEYDPKANRHAYKVTYYVSPYKKPSTKQFPGSPATSIAKNYNYMFTGENYDILELDIKFDLAFYNNVEHGTKNAGAGTKKNNTNSRRASSEGNSAKNNNDAASAQPTEVRASQNKMNPEGNETDRALRGSELKRSIIQESTGDMITFDMTILGDPDFIKQDDITFRSAGPEFEKHKDNPYTKNESIKQDDGDVFINLKFRVLDDINHDSGLRDEGRYIPFSNFARTSTFDGHYRVLMIENMFENGTFMQQLTVARVYVQPAEIEQAAISSESDIESIDQAALLGDQFALDLIDTEQYKRFRTENGMRDIFSNTEENQSSGGGSVPFEAPDF